MNTRNKVSLIGRLANDPEVRYTKTGKAVTSFRLAVGRDKYQPDDPDISDFFPVVTWGSIAEACGDSLAKGYRVLIEGRLQTRSYEVNDGQKRYITEIVADLVSLDIYTGSKSKASAAPRAEAPPAGAPAGFDQFGSAIDEQIPF